MQTAVKGSQWLDRYSAWIIRYRWLVIIITIVAALWLASGARFLEFNNDYRVFFSEENPQLQAFEQLQRTYTKIDNVTFAVTPNDGEVFSPDVLTAVEEITQASWLLPFVLRVDSISNFQHTYSEEDDLIVEDLIENAAVLSTEELGVKQNIALAEPFLVGLSVNPQATVTGVNVTFQMPQKDTDEAPIVVAAARELKAQIEAKYPVTVHLSGIVMMSNAFFESSMNDMMTLIPAMYLVIIAAIFLLVRSLSATVSTVLVIFLSMLAAMGTAGWIGIKLTPPSSAATTIIMTLAVADSIHVLVTLFNGMRKGMIKNEAIRYSLRLNMSPVLLTSITTAVGFLSMNFSDAPPFHDLGNITAFGVMVAFVLSVTLLPALMSVLPAKAQSSQSKFSQWMEFVGDFVVRRNRIIFGSSILVSALILAAIPLNVLDDNFVGYFSKATQFRQDTDYVTENLTGLYQLQYSIDSGNNNGVSDPEFLKKVSDFADWFRSQPEVIHVDTITDTFKRLNKNLHGDDPAYYRLPEDRELAAQYLLLYELSLPYGLDLNNQLNVSKSATQMRITLEDMTSVRLREIAERGSQWLKENANIDSYGVGPSVMFAHISERNIKSMLVGTIVAIFVISILITLALRNIRLGLLSLVPNLLPVGLAFGLWGILSAEVNVAVSMVAGMALGIVVDDTVHFLSKYLRARREEHLGKEAAVRYAFSSVGVAIVVTSLVLVVGLSVLAQSDFGMNSNMAVLTAIAIAMALIADFLLLPALLLRVDRKSYQIEKMPVGGEYA